MTDPEGIYAPGWGYFKPDDPAPKDGLPLVVMRIIHEIDLLTFECGACGQNVLSADAEDHASERHAPCLLKFDLSNAKEIP